MRNKSVLAIGIAAALAAGSVASAQTPSPTAVRLQLKQSPQVQTGKAALVQGTSKAAGDRFFVENLSIIQPVIVTLLARNKEDDVKLQLSKYRFDQADKTASTKGTGKATIKLRTQGEMKIVVSGADPMAYQLLIWAGEEVKPELPPVVLAKPDVTGVQRGVSVVAVALLVAGASLLTAGFFLLKKRRADATQRPTAVVLAIAGALTYGAVSSAQTPSELTMERLWTDLLDIGSLVNENARNLRDLQSAFERLNDGDGRYDPNYAPEGQPEVPISCATAECQQCYEQPIRRLNHVRVTLEQLRAIYQSTKDMADKAMASGGSEAEMAKLEASYDDKYRGLLNTLRSALDQMSACEREHFNNPDWYNRFGFTYYSFMTDRYRR